MRGCLRKYLTTKLGPQHVPVPEVLASTLNTTRERLAVNLPNLTNETTANFFFAGNHVVPLVTDFVFNMDGVPVQLEEAPMTHGAKPDGIWGCGVHVEFLSPRALLNHVPEIFALGRANYGKGSALVFREQERDGRSIILKGFLPISWFLLLLNDLSDWYKHGHNCTRDLTRGILTSGLVSIFFSTFST